MFVWYFKEENTLRFWRLCGRIEKTRRKETAVTLQQLRYVTVVAGTGTISHAVQQFYISQPSLTNAIRELEQEVGLALSKTASSVVSRTLLDAAGRTRTNECKIDASPCLRSKEMSKEEGSAGEDEAPPQGRLVPSPQHKAACFLPWLPDKTKYNTRKGSFARTFVPLYRCAQNA